MSNISVGAAYQAIIEEVVNSSRGDFEDLGVEESVLEALRKGWQQKLSSLRVAEFPWDPKPEAQPAQVTQQPPQQSAAPAPQQSQPQQQAQFTQAQLAPQTSPVSQAPSHITLPPIPHANGARIKQESGLEVNSQYEDPKVKAEPMPHSFPNANAAQQRATALLQQNFGQRASASINAINSGMSQPQLHQQQQQQAPQQRPGQGQPNPNTYHQSIVTNAQQRMQQLQKPHPNQQIPQHHMDGATDTASEDAPVGILLKNGAELGRVEVDRMLHKQLLANAKSMEGGGLMVTLREVPKGTTKAKMAEMGLSTKETPIARGQFDGNMDEDEEDEDAINSDLDDSDDNSGSDDEDDEGNNVILCVYDKVQRVKNKWKCVLKDGLLTVGGRDYVFHKATGEYEW